MSAGAIKYEFVTKYVFLKAWLKKQAGLCYNK